MNKTKLKAFDCVMHFCVKHGLPNPVMKFRGTRICVGNAYIQETSRKGRWNVSCGVVRLEDVPLRCGMSEGEAIKTLLITAFRDEIYKCKALANEREGGE